MGARQAIVALAVTSVLLALTACTSAGRPVPADALSDNAITIGSFDFPESALLATLYGQAMRTGGFHVRYARNLGPREFAEPALARGLVELLPEYAGTALLFLSRNQAVPSSDPTVNHRRLVRALQGTDVTALASAPAQDANSFAVTIETAGRYNLRNISDLRPVASRLTFAGPPECPSRPFCGLGLRRTYGLDIKKFLPTDAGGPLTLQALRTGLVDVGLVFSTDPSLTTGLLELHDDRRLQPGENVTPLVRREVVRRWGSPLTRLIDGVSARLTTDELRNMNREVITEKRRVSEVAAEWLEREGIK